MRSNCSKTVLVLSTLAMLCSASAFAGGGHNGGRGGQSGCGSQPSQPSQPTNPDTNPDTTPPAQEPSVCDSWADAEIYDLYNESTNSQYVDIGWTDAASSSVVVEGVGIKVSAWSDTGNYNGDWVSDTGVEGDGSGYWYGAADEFEQDSTVETASLAGPWSGNGGEYGFGLSNDDAYDFHAIDNLESDFGEIDYDMVLFSFSEAVSLTGATFSWLNSDVSTQQVSIAGFDSLSDASSWSAIAGSVATGMSGSFSIENCNDVFQSTFTTTGTAQYWLVGAYNAAFGFVDSFSQNDDAWKLASIGFTKVSDDDDDGSEPVNAPSSFALLLLAGGFAAWRRKQA